MKKNRDPRWEDEFQFMVEEPPTNDKLHVEVVSTSSRNLLRPKVHDLYNNFLISKTMNRIFMPSTNFHSIKIEGYVIFLKFESTIIIKFTYSCILVINDCLIKIDMVKYVFY